MRRSLLAGVMGVAVLVAGLTVRAADLPDILKRGEMRVVVGNDSLFFNLQPTGLPGLDHEVLAGFTKLHGVRLVTVPIASWDAAIPMLLEGKGDVVAGGFSITAVRRRQIEFTNEVFPSRLAAFSRKPNPVVTSLEQLRGLKVGASKGTSMEAALLASGVPASNIIYVPAGSVETAVAEDQVQAAVAHVEHIMLARRQYPELQMGFYLGPATSLGYGTRKEDIALRKALNDYIADLRSTSVLNHLIVKYLGTDAVPILKHIRQ